MDINFLNTSTLYIIEGIGVTLQYTLIALILGAIVGSMISLCRISHIKALKIFASIYTSVFRGTPLLVQLSLIYFVVPSFGYNITVFESGIAAFSLNSAAYVSEIIRSGINSVDKGQFEASKALSLSYYDMMRGVIMPQALRNILPSLVNEAVNLLKETAIISVIGGVDIMRRAQTVSEESYDYLAPLITAACCYYILVLIFSTFAKIVENKVQLK
jgi:polar amino acid transport system permease protein